jgi:hypothetical protein
VVGLDKERGPCTESWKRSRALVVVLGFKSSADENVSWAPWAPRDEKKSAESRQNYCAPEDWKLVEWPSTVGQPRSC